MSAAVEAIAPATESLSLRDQLMAWARREPTLAALFAAATVAVLLPVWIGRYLPLLDYPNHLSLAFVWFHLHEPAWNFEPYYASHLVPIPYWGQYGIIYLLAFPFGVEVAQKLFLCLALLALPVGVALYARRVGRDPRLAIFAFPLAWNYNVANGFISYAAGAALLFFALAALDRYAERPSAAWAAWASLAGTSLYFFHILPWVTFLILGGATALMTPRPWSLRRALVAQLPLLPAVAVGVWAYRASRTMDIDVSPWSPRGLAAIEAIYWDLAGVLRNLPEWLMDLFPGQRDEAAAIVLALAWLLLMTTRSLRPRTSDSEGEVSVEDDHGPRAWRLEVALALATVLLFFLPRTLRKPFYWFAVNSREAVVVVLLAALAVRGRLVGARRLLLYVAAIAAVLYPLDVAAHFYRFNRRARGFEEVMALVPPGKRVLPIMLNLTDQEVNVSAFNQWGSYVQMRQGGYLSYNINIQFPVRHLLELPAPRWDHPEQFRFALHAGPWDYFLVRGPSPVDPFAGAHERVKLLRQSGEWAVWEKLP